MSERGRKFPNARQRAQILYSSAQKSQKPPPLFAKSSKSTNPNKGSTQTQVKEKKELCKWKSDRSIDEKDFFKGCDPWSKYQFWGSAKKVQRETCDFWKIEDHYPRVPGAAFEAHKNRLYQVRNPGMPPLGSVFPFHLHIVARDKNRKDHRHHNAARRIRHPVQAASQQVQRVQSRSRCIPTKCDALANTYQAPLISIRGGTHQIHGRGIQRPPGPMRKIMQSKSREEKSARGERKNNPPTISSPPAASTPGYYRSQMALEAEGGYLGNYHSTTSRAFHIRGEQQP